MIGFLGNEAVAVYRMRVGRAIGSAALVADGLHARDRRVDLARRRGRRDRRAGRLPRADAIVGLLITLAIGYTLVEAARTVLRRVLDGIDEPTMRLIEASAAAVTGVEHVTEARARWVGHQLRAELAIDVPPQISVEAGHDIAEQRPRGAPAATFPGWATRWCTSTRTSTILTVRPEPFPSLAARGPYHGRSMDEIDPPAPADHRRPDTATAIPNVETGVHCTRCGRPICPECMIPAPVGHQCPECVNEARREFRQGPGRRIAVANVRRRASADHCSSGR